jgi:hypothetical protein
MRGPMNIKKPLALAVCALAATVSTASADVQLSMANGRVSIVATDATVRQILTEWARVGQTRIVNVERIPGGPLTLELTDVPEDQALDLLLRSVSGYLAAPRPTMVANASRFDRIIVMPTSATPRQPAAAVAAAPPPMFNTMPQPVDDDPEDERPGPNVGMPTPNPRGPVFTPFPQPQVVNPQLGPNGFLTPQQQQQMMMQPPAGAPQTPGAYPGAPTAPPGSVSTPGMVAPVAPQPGQTGAPVPAPGQPGTPVRRPGGPGSQ